MSCNLLDRLDHDAQPHHNLLHSIGADLNSGTVTETDFIPRLSMAFADRLYNLLGVPRPFDPTHKFTSSYLISPLPLALIRLLFCLYAFVTIFYSLGYESTSSRESEQFGARHHLSYFTNLSYWGLSFYCLFSGLHGLAWHFESRTFSSSAAVARSENGYSHSDREKTSNGVENGHHPSTLETGNGSGAINGTKEEISTTAPTILSSQREGTGKSTIWHHLDLNNWPRPLQVLHTMLYATIMTYPFLVTIVFWAVLYSNPWWPLTFDGWHNVGTPASDHSSLPIFPFFLPLHPSSPVQPDPVPIL